MSWLRLDDTTMSHPKVRGLTDPQFRCWIRMLCVCSQHDDPTVDNTVILEVSGLGPALVKKFADAGLLDSTPHGYAVHNWNLYRPKDPTAADRMRRHRRNKDRNDERNDTVTPRGRAALPVPSPALHQAELTPPAPAITDQETAAALIEKLDELNIAGGLRVAALQDPHRALACATKAQTSARGNPAGYFRKLLESGDNPTATNGATEHRPYRPPTDPESVVRKMITNGAITDVVTLNAELTALGINGTTADDLRSLIPADTPTDLDLPDRDPDADIPFD